MSLKPRDVCIVCSKIVKKIHKNICCNKCKGHIHKKCTKLKPKELACLDTNEWICQICNLNVPTDTDCEIEKNVNDLNECSEFDINDVDFQKYDDMIFNPLRFNSDSSSGKAYNDTCDETMHKCTYLTPEQFRLDPEASRRNLKLLNANIRSISKTSNHLKNVSKH